MRLANMHSVRCRSRDCQNKLHDGYITWGKSQQYGDVKNAAVIVPHQFTVHVYVMGAGYG